MIKKPVYDQFSVIKMESLPRISDSFLSRYDNVISVVVKSVIIHHIDVLSLLFHKLTVILKIFRKIKCNAKNVSK